MKRSRRSNRRLMDQLPPEPTHGQLLGMLSTTYEFDSHFLETDYLPALLGLGSWDDTGWMTRVKLENRLAELEGIWIATDQRRYGGRPRSMRVELRPGIGNRGALLHAKVTVLVLERAVRLLVGSANLTPWGFRLNREVMTTITATAETPEHVELLHQALTGLREHAQGHWSPTADRLLDLALERSSRWPRSKSSARFAWSDERNPLWKQVAAAWPSGVELRAITVVSPFWSEEDRSGPLRQLLTAIRQTAPIVRGVPVRLLTEAVADGDGFRATRPPFQASRLEDLGVRVTAQAVHPLPLDDDQPLDRRPRRLHAKVLLLEGKSHALAYAGSANFTRHGFGVPGVIANIEAGLFVSGRPEELRAALLPPTTGPVIEIDDAEASAPATEADEGAPSPTFLRGIWLEPNGASSPALRLRAEVDADEVTGPWSLSVDADSASLLQGDRGSTASATAELEPAQLERILRLGEVVVRWWASQTPVTYPVNVERQARASLPVSPGSRGPEEPMLLAYYQGRIRYEDLFPPPPGWVEEDGGPRPLSPPDLFLVDTSAIQSYQVREFVEALAGLRADLLRASSATEAAMLRAVVGTISPVALAAEVLRLAMAGQRSPIAAGFELVEIASCLIEARHAPGHGSAWPIVVEQGLERVRTLLEQLVARHPELKDDSTEFPAYVAALRISDKTGRTP